jgi:hypothetical protein
MTTQRTRRPPRGAAPATVWIQHDQALIVEPGQDPAESVEIVTRSPAETEAAFQHRALDRVVDDDRVVVTGPAYARTAFERAYVALTHRPDQLIDVEPRRARRRR